MSTISSSVEIARSPADVFAYIDQVTRHSEWQDDLVSSRLETDGPVRVGSKVTDVRKLGGREQSITYEITEHDPPRVFAFRGLDGPIRPVGRGTIEPLGDGESSRVTLELDLNGHGLMGKALVGVARSQAAKQLPKDQQKLKERLESGTV
jgi:uncharacterized protein YndB with AHSA1/START domain